MVLGNHHRQEIALPLREGLEEAPKTGCIGYIIRSAVLPRGLCPFFNCERMHFVFVSRAGQHFPYT